MKDWYPVIREKPENKVAVSPTPGALPLGQNLCPKIWRINNKKDELKVPEKERLVI